MDVKRVAERCAHFINVAGDRRGVAGHILARYVDAYRDATGEEQEQVHALLAKTPGLAYLVRSGSWTFWPRAKAPEEATRV